MEAGRGIWQLMRLSVSQTRRSLFDLTRILVEVEAEGRNNRSPKKQRSSGQVEKETLAGLGTRDSPTSWRGIMVLGIKYCGSSGKAAGSVHAGSTCAAKDKTKHGLECFAGKSC